MNILRILIGGLWLVSSGALVGESSNIARNPVLSEVLSTIQRLEKKPIDEPANECFLAWDYANSKNDSATAISGVVSLWKKQNRALVELVWWRQRDSEVRKSILLLFYCLSKVEADNFPNFEKYAARFEPVEAASRKKEIEEVKTIAAQSAAELRKILLQPSKK